MADLTTKNAAGQTIHLCAGSGDGTSGSPYASPADVGIGTTADAAAASDAGTFSLIALVKRLLVKITNLLPCAVAKDTTTHATGMMAGSVYDDAVIPWVQLRNAAGDDVLVTDDPPGQNDRGLVVRPVGQVVTAGDFTAPAAPAVAVAGRSNFGSGGWEPLLIDDAGSLLVYVAGGSLGSLTIGDNATLGDHGVGPAVGRPVHFVGGRSSQASPTAVGDSVCAMAWMDNFGSLFVNPGGAQTAAFAAAAGGPAKASRGRLCRVLVTAAGTGSGSVLIYDNASAASGTIIGALPATVAAGTVYDFDMPAASGIFVVNQTNGPALTVSYR